MSKNYLEVKLLTTSAYLPERATPQSAGLDLRSPIQDTVPANGKTIIDLEISITLPSGTYGRIAPRSGLASKFSIHVGAGVIDRDYQGSLKVVLFNLGTEKYIIKKGDAIAQLICEKIILPDVILDTYRDDIKETMRGEGGFGSTDK